MVGDGGLVTNLLPGAPAARSRQMAVGDHIIAVDDMSTLLLGSDVAIGTLLLGSDVAGSTVQLRLRSQRDHVERDVVLERMPV
jgi:C-terminal processing protease CtpA/Prc